MRWLFVILVVGCGSTPPVAPTPPVPSPPPRVAPSPPTMLAIPAPAPVAKSKQVCSPVAQPAVVLGRKLRTYDFTPSKLSPNASGAIPVGYRRHPDSIRAAISAEADSIASCVQEASRRGVQPPLRVGAAAHFELVASVTIDPFGAPSSVTVEGDGDSALRDCIGRVLQLARVARRTPRATSAKVPLYLLGSADKKLPKPQPLRVKPRIDRAGCLLAIDPIPYDSIEIPEIVINWLPGEYSNPRQRCGTRDIDKAQIRRTMEDSRYAFEACFASAPNTRGQIDLQFVIGSHGVPTNIAIKGAGEAMLHACITAAIENVGFTRPEVPIVVNWPFALEEAPPTTFTADCAGRAAWIATMSIHDPRAWTAIDDLAGAGCEFPETLDRFARFGVPENRVEMYRGRGTEEAIGSSAGVIDKFPTAAQRLLLFLADSQVALGREADARANYVRFLALPNNDAKQIERAAEGYARAVALRDDTAPIDFCEESSPY